MKLLTGVLLGCFVLAPLLVFGYVKAGFLSLATSAKPFPLERFMAKTALRASMGQARDTPDPLTATEDNLAAGVKEYREHCAVCHGLPGQPITVIAHGMFPDPPQLFEGKEMVTDDAEGVIYWKISNGIRLSGMPRFDRLPESERWQLTMILKRADQLPPAVQAQLRAPLTEPSR